VSAWNAMLGEFPQQKIDLLLRLKEQMPIYLLSNTNEIHMPKVYEAWNKVSNIPMDQIFTEVFLSFEIGKRKPDVSTFNWVCEKLQIDPSKTLFLEDSPQHIEGAKKAGLNTFFYQNATDFYALFS
jgi:putative hydrolase of the HAD superfamily